MSRFKKEGILREDATGAVISDAAVTVYLAGTDTLAAIYGNKTVGNPLSGSQATTSSKGKYIYYVDDADYPNYQLFKEVITKTGFDTITYDDIDIIETVFDHLDVDGNITVGGNVGIGTTDPGTRKLKVAGDIEATGDWYWLPSKNFQLYPTANDQEWSFDLRNQGTYTGNSWQVWSDKTGIGSILVVRGDTGYVGIGTTGPGYTLTVNGTAWVTSGAWSGSDIRWKKDITPLSVTSSLAKVMQLNPVSFDWRTNEFPNMHFSSSTQLGFIAQDVEKIIPEVVITDNNGYKGLSYERITPILTGAIQEQQKQIEELKSEIKKLKSCPAN